jgi:hypothetical protein
MQAAEACAGQDKSRVEARIIAILEWFMRKTSVISDVFPSA